MRSISFLLVLFLAACAQEPTDRGGIWNDVARDMWASVGFSANPETGQVTYDPRIPTNTRELHEDRR